MAHFLDINQLLEEASAQDLDGFQERFEALAQELAEKVAAKRGDVAIVSDASFQDSFGGLCVGFGPVNKGDKCPEDFAQYDQSSDWAEDSEDESESEPET